MSAKKKKNKLTLTDLKNKSIEIALYLISYTITFLIVEYFFKSFYISSDYKILYAFLAVTIIYVLNQVIKPLIVTSFPLLIFLKYSDTKPFSCFNTLIVYSDSSLLSLDIT